MDVKNDNNETKPELVEAKVEKKKEYKELHGFGLAVTVVYSLLVLTVVYFLGLYLLAGIMVFNIVDILITLVGFVIVSLPYFLFSKASQKRDKRLLNIAVIYELCFLVIAVLYFTFSLWPAIKKNINNQWCGIVEQDGNEVPCGRRTR